LKINKNKLPAVTPSIDRANRYYIFRANGQEIAVMGVKKWTKGVFGWKVGAWDGKYWYASKMISDDEIKILKQLSKSWILEINNNL
jgi:hypothetical protein